MIGAAVDGDLEQIVDRTKRTGALGYLRSSYEAFRRRLVTIEPGTHDPSTYDLVIVGTPIWNLSVSSPVRSYLHHHGGALRNVAFFCTCGGRGQERVFAQMADLCGAKPLVTLAIRDDEVRHPEEPIARFVAEIDRKLPGMTPVAIAPEIRESRAPDSERPRR